VAVICDTAVLIAADRRDRRVAALARAAAQRDVELLVAAGCVAQAWRDGARQAPLGRFLAGCRELPLDGGAARAAGALLGATRTSDVIDASVAAAAAPGDTVLTGDVADLTALIDAASVAGVRVERFG
jgi:predicted nucleic acid-binding protein